MMAVSVSQIVPALDIVAHVRAIQAVRAKAIHVPASAFIATASSQAALCTEYSYKS